MDDKNPKQQVNTELATGYDPSCDAEELNIQCYSNYWKNQKNPKSDQDAAQFYPNHHDSSTKYTNFLLYQYRRENKCQSSAENLGKKIYLELFHPISHELPRCIKITNQKPTIWSSQRIIT